MYWLMKDVVNIAGIDILGGLSKDESIYYLYYKGKSVL